MLGKHTLETGAGATVCKGTFPTQKPNQAARLLGSHRVIYHESPNERSCLVTRQFSSRGNSQLSGWPFLRITSTHRSGGTILLTQSPLSISRAQEGSIGATRPAFNLWREPQCKCPAHTVTGESLTWLARARHAGTVQQTSKMEKGHRTCGTSNWSWDVYSYHQGSALFPAMMHRAVSVPRQVLWLHIYQLQPPPELDSCSAGVPAASPPLTPDITEVSPYPNQHMR